MDYDNGRVVKRYVIIYYLKICFFYEWYSCYKILFGLEIKEE